MKHIVTFILIIFQAQLFAQLQDTLPILLVNKPIGELKQEDWGEKYLDFGIPVPVDSVFHFSLQKSKQDVYQKFLKIKTISATSLNLLLENIRISKDVNFEFISSTQEKLGPYSLADLTQQESFLSWPIKGNTLTIRFWSSQQSEISFKLKHVVYGMLELNTRAFGQSGACNVNINCPEGLDWQKEKRSVLMLISGSGARYCTGTLVNNTAQDGRPYVLTAKHCNVGANSSFMFNYESPDCSNTDGPIVQTLQGTHIRAIYDVSDVCLLELHQSVPSNFSSYFSGWSRDTLATDSVVGIHHPRGDIKKISFENHMVRDSCYTCVGPSLDYWYISHWENGTTEPASSGSALFDKNHRIIGQLRGGQASCLNSVSDFYGKFSTSWEGGGTPATRLKDWLDPVGTQTFSLDGIQGGNPNPNKSIQIGYFGSNSTIICEDSLVLTAQIMNNGNVPIQELIYSWGTEPLLIEYGNWYYGDLVTLTKVVKNVPFGKQNYQFKAWNTQQGVEVSDSAEYDIERVLSKPSYIHTQFDSYPHETSWFIVNRQGDTLAKEIGSHYPPSTKTIQNLCLPEACYSLIVKDSGNDGFCCKFGTGYIKLENGNGQIFEEISHFTTETQIDFCVPVVNFEEDHLFVFPNPATDYAHILIPENLLDQDLELSVCDMQGRIIIKKAINTKYLHTFDVTTWSQGVYVVYIRGKKIKVHTRFVKL